MFTVITINLNAQTIPNEQIALNYFFEEIFLKNYNNVRSIYFSGNTENLKKMTSPFGSCFKSNFDFKDFIYNHKTVETEPIHFNINDKIKILKRPRSRKPYIKVYRYITQRDKFYVYIDLYIKKIMLLITICSALSMEKLPITVL